MSEFVMAYSSIPNQKLHINEGMMKKILNQQQSSCFDQAKQFTKMFTNVQLENASLSSETTGCNSQVHTQKKKTEEFRYHIKKSMIEKLQRIHRSPGKEKKIIRTKIPKPKQNNVSVCDSRADLVNISASNKHKDRPIRIRSNSYNDKSYYSEIIQFRQKNKPCVEQLQKIQGNQLLHDQTQKLEPKESIIKTNKKLNITQVKDQIKKLICNQTETEQDDQIEEQEDKQIQPNYMFIEDDRDRFGNQLYPISIGNVQVPGPGQYETNTQSLEYRIQKLNERAQQKRLISIWQQQI